MAGHYLLSKRATCPVMRLLPCLAMILVCHMAQAQSPEDEVKTLHEKYCRAVEVKDSVFLKNLFHDKMVITGGNGSRRDKAGEIRDSLDPRYAVNYFRTRDLQLVTAGATVVATGDLYWEMVYEGQTMQMARRFTFTYAKIGSEWKILAQHMGRVPPADGK